MVEEYAILRKCIVELVHDKGAPAIRSAQLARLHAGIDSAIVPSTARYHQASERTLRALERISSTALTHGEAEAMLPELLKVLLETCASVDAASLLLLLEGEVLRVHAAVGLGLEKTVGEIVPVGHSLAGRVAQTRAPIASREAASDPMVTRESIRRTGLRGYYGVPMMLGEELVGVATIGSRHAAEFSEEDRLLFRTMSGRAAALIAKARLNAELTQRNAELSAALDYRDRMLGILSHDLKNPLGRFSSTTRWLRSPLASNGRDSAQAEHDDIGAGLHFRSEYHRADAGGDATADIAGGIERCVGPNFCERDFRYHGVVCKGRGAHVVVDGLILVGKARGPIGHEAAALRGANRLAQVGLARQAEFALAAFRRVQRDHVVALFQAFHVRADVEHHAG